MHDAGVVLCSLDDLLLIAAERWRVPLTQHELARLSGLSRSTINALLPRQVQTPAAGGGQVETELIRYGGRIALRTVAGLCSTFICLPGELLRYRAPGQSLPRLSANAVRRSEVPPRPVHVYPLTNTIPDRLKERRPADLARATGISWSTWKRVKAGTSQIELSTLAALCAVLNTDVSGLLTHTAPFRSATWSIRFVRVDERTLAIDLSHGVTVSVSLGRWKALTDASPAARNQWRLTDDRQGVRWDDLDVEIYPRLLLG